MESGPKIPAAASTAASPSQARRSPRVGPPAGVSRAQPAHASSDSAIVSQAREFSRMNAVPVVDVNGSASLTEKEIGSTHPSRRIQPPIVANSSGLGRRGVISPPRRESRR